METLPINGFTKLVETLPKDLKVLDVGAGALAGVNTSSYLIQNFPNYTGICLPKPSNQEVFDEFQRKYPKATIISDDFYTYQFTEKYDLVVMDLPPYINIKDWVDGFTKARKLLNPGGRLIVYMETPLLLEGAELDGGVYRENIVWLKLKETNG